MASNKVTTIKLDCSKHFKAIVSKFSTAGRSDGSLFLLAVYLKVGEGATPFWISTLAHDPYSTQLLGIR